MASGKYSIDTRQYDEPEEMSLTELVERAGVSVRTVRYYIAEGLLPPPLSTGPGSSYGPGHLLRLRLIQRLKDAYLPLKEIRRRLAGLDDDEVRVILTEEDAVLATSLAETTADAAMASAREYLAMMESRAHYRTAPLDLAMPDASPSVAPRRSVPPAFPSVPEPLAPSLSGPDAPVPGDDAVIQDRNDRSAAEGNQGLWRRIPLGDSAELMIAEPAYNRHRERVDWLVRWARKVFA
jgi:DNA-binding transcriptional MerR regulator